jgi:hypothetical protein
MMMQNPLRSRLQAARERVWGEVRLQAAREAGGWGGGGVGVEAPHCGSGVPPHAAQISLRLPCVTPRKNRLGRLRRAVRGEALRSSRSAKRDG